MADYIQADDPSGNVQTLSTTDYLADFPGATLKTATQAFSFAYNGVTLSFAQNQVFPVDSNLLAALTAAGAPIA